MESSPRFCTFVFLLTFDPVITKLKKFQNANLKHISGPFSNLDFNGQNLKLSLISAL